MSADEQLDEPDFSKLKKKKKEKKEKKDPEEAAEGTKEPKGDAEEAAEDEDEAEYLASLKKKKTKKKKVDEGEGEGEGETMGEPTYSYDFLLQRCAHCKLTSLDICLVHLSQGFQHSQDCQPWAGRSQEKVHFEASKCGAGWHQEVRLHQLQGNLQPDEPSPGASACLHPDRAWCAFFLHALKIENFEVEPVEPWLLVMCRYDWVVGRQRLPHLAWPFYGKAH